ncbi:secretory component protein shr3 [Ascosphaera apis ARSEF 7405]|uniref:Secretory component protein shr3 n=1 Tax=Ascosphaera apis ARSEF 7405 TaxID=392613 RepID=A0A162IDI9_9EURO|nr:secretory component protein shr3 [Ascosphaera apis ARSEF 7405]
MARTTFATFLIVCPTCFFLGIVFSLLPYDYPLLWSPEPTPASYYDFAEAHLKFLHASPPLISRMLHTTIAVTLIGFLIKLYKPSESNLLFDGASLVLFMCGVVVYVANIVKGLRTATAGAYGTGHVTAEEAASGAEPLLSREDSLKVLSASNTILALVLVGVLVLQAGQWYADRKEQQEIEAEAKKERQHQHQHQHEKHQHEKGQQHEGSAAQKKKQ